MSDRSQTTDRGSIPRWRVQQVLRDYADAIEQGAAPEKTAPDALREAAEIMEHVAWSESQPDKPQPSVRAPSKPWLPQWDEEILREWDKPTSIAEFARRFGIKPTRVANAAKRLGVWK